MARAAGEAGGPGAAGGSKPKTRVYITVDVECAEERVVGGKSQAPMGYDLRMWGRFDNQREELGIPLLTRALGKHGFKGTFFVEPFGASFFGADGLHDVCEFLRDGSRGGGGGHDVQLHTHPIQREVTWRSKGLAPPADDIGAYPRGLQEDLLRRGRSLLVDAGVPAASLNSFRAGNFGADNETWFAVADAGLVLSSNYNPCYFGKNCKMRYPAARPGLFASPASPVWELPITCFEEVGGGFRHLQIAAVSVPEMAECLRRCRALGIGEVTIVTHSFELYFIDSIPGRRGRLNEVNASRFEGLLAFLAAHRDEFEVDTVGALAARLPRWDRGGDGPDGDGPRPPHPRGKVLQRLARVAEQAYKRAARRLRAS